MYMGLKDQQVLRAQPAIALRRVAAPHAILAAAIALGLALSPVVAAEVAATDAAASADSNEKKPPELEPVVTTASVVDAYTVGDSSAATKLSMSLRETPQSVTVITRERLDDQDLKSLRAVLDNTAGVYSDAYDSERVLFYSRGFLIDSLLYDGVPAISNFNTGSIDETLDTALYDRIEVVRGATGLMTGAGSPGASINLVRKRADSRTPTVSFDVSAGSWNDRRIEADVAVPLNTDGSVRGRAVAVYEDRDSYQDFYQKKTKVLYGTIDADLSPNTLLSVGFDYQNNQPRANTWGSFPLFLGNGQPADWPRSVTTAADWTYWDRRTETLFGELRHTFDNDWSVRSTLSWRRYNEDVALLYMYGFPDPVTGEGLEPSAYRSKSEIIERSLDLYATGPFSLFGRQHELVVGYNGSRASNTGVEFEPLDMADPGNFFEWNGSYPKPQFSEGTPLNDIDTDQNGIYAAARFSLTDPLTLITGARYATWKIDSFYVYDDPILSHYDYKKTIPYAGLVYDVSADFSLFASYTSIFKPQNNRDINGHYLDPIDGQSFEVGIKGEHFDGKLNTSLTVFETRQNNVAGPVFDPETGEPILLPDGSQVSRAIDGTRTRGFEAEAAGRLNEEWQASLGWSHYVMEDGDGQPVRTYIPRTLVRLFATWKPVDWLSGLALGGGVNWQSKSSTFVSSPDGGTILRQSDVTQLSLMARYQFTPHVSLQFNGNNLLDKKYYVLDEYDNTYYGSPANYALSLRVTF